MTGHVTQMLLGALLGSHAKEEVGNKYGWADVFQGKQPVAP